jgi:hypothetical protein
LQVRDGKGSREGIGTEKITSTPDDALKDQPLEQLLSSIEIPLRTKIEEKAKTASLYDRSCHSPLSYRVGVDKRDVHSRSGRIHAASIRVEAIHGNVSRAGLRYKMSGDHEGVVGGQG